LGLADYLSDRGAEPVKIKWPNDMMIGNKKVAGILIENTVVSNHIQQSVVGIGVNINQTVFKAPTATSLGLATEKVFSLPDEWAALMQKIEYRYVQLKNSNKGLLETDYLTRLFRFRQSSWFQVDGKRVVGIIESVTASGKLVVKINGEIRSFSLKEIQFSL
ncbi:MAG: biotin--[acetyl-CoA-carboxylase] ligase, partial [Flammeovirgaceae bacterium]